MSDEVIRFDNISTIDRTLYYQCREYIKLCLMIEELQCFKENDGSYTYQDLIDETIFKSSVLLMEFEASLKRLKNKKDESNEDGGDENSSN